MSDCLKKETLLAFADLELAPGEMESAERHVAACAHCHEELESVRAKTAKVDALISSLVPDGASDAEAVAAVGIHYKSADARARWAAVSSVVVLAAALILFVVIRRQHPAPEPSVAKKAAPAVVSTVAKKEPLVASVTKPAHVETPKAHMKVRRFQALDNGEPMETGMIYRVSLPASVLPNASASQSAKRIPAEVIVDEFGKVRAIRFLQ